MFRDSLLPKKDETARRDSRSVNVTPDLSPSPSPRPQETVTPSTAPKAEEATGSKLIVGPNIKLKGAEITDCDTLVVEGRVEAAMDSRVIKIAEKGVFSGTARIDTAEAHGQFEGELTARKQLIVHSTGRVQGKIRYGQLKIDEGGQIAGDVNALSATDGAKPAATGTETTSPDIMTAYDPFGRKAKPQH